MNPCSSLYYLSAVACRLSECMNENELKILASDLRTLGEMIESALAHKCPAPADD